MLLQGYYDEEGWYYPPPGEEGLGEVPDMPPAVGEGAQSSGRAGQEVFVTDRMDLRGMFIKSEVVNPDSRTSKRLLNRP